MSRSNRTVVLFTQWFPHNKVLEQSFLSEEIRALQANFDKVYIVPQLIDRKDTYELPEGVQADESLAIELQNISLAIKLRVITSGLFWSELFRIKFHSGKRKFALTAMLTALTTRKWVKEFKKKHPEPCVFYSFWMNANTLGFTLTKERGSQDAIVTRCHNFDLYGNETNHFYVPFFNTVYSQLDAVFPDSHYGMEYLKSMCPTARVKNGIMGVADPGVVNQASQDGVFRVISCAYMIPRKRVALFAEGLARFSANYPDRKIEWNHIGDGPQRDEIEAIVNAICSPSCTVNFLGNLSHAEMKDVYQRLSLDLFVNTSSKEGTPVSLMEAISHGIPLMVTGFGGNKEMAEMGAGWTLSPDPSPIEIADRLYEIIENNDREAVRLKSKEVWNLGYNSETNYIRFCEQLKSL